jgi:hypothetical protein
VSLPELAREIPKHLDKLAPAARQIFEAEPEAIAREQELMAARVASLRPLSSLRRNGCPV